MHIYTFIASASSQLFNTVVIQLFRAVSSFPYRKGGLFVDTNLQQPEGLVPHEWAHKLKSLMSLHSNQWKGVLVLSSPKTYDDIFFDCFIASASSGPFQTLFSRLISYQLVISLIYPKDRLVSQARPFWFPWQHWSHIGYEYWKRPALWN